MAMKSLLTYGVAVVAVVAMIPAEVATVAAVGTQKLHLL
jgi:hypothetical protein